jgi:hypothetical protein
VIIDRHGSGGATMANGREGSALHPRASAAWKLDRAGGLKEKEPFVAAEPRCELMVLENLCLEDF